MTYDNTYDVLPTKEALSCLGVKSFYWKWQSHGTGPSSRMTLATQPLASYRGQTQQCSLGVQVNKNRYSLQIILLAKPIRFGLSPQPYRNIPLRHCIPRANRWSPRNLSRTGPRFETPQAYWVNTSLHTNLLNNYHVQRAVINTLIYIS